MGYDQQGAAMLTLAKAGNEAAQRAAYLDYVNNFLTVTGFANYYGLSPQSAEIYLAWWKDVHEAHCAALKQLESEAERLRETIIRKAAGIAPDTPLSEEDCARPGILF